MWTSNSHLYDYKMAIVLNDVGGWNEHHQMLLLLNFEKTKLIDSIGSFCLLLFRSLYLDKSGCICVYKVTTSSIKIIGEIKDMLINLFKSIS